ncbi:uncharacterized protein LOC119109783 [Pollicipes pollicipes]|uniref:uncharacterized protein LOC119109783 n=1 Tax=Pollicipes pollicipes TaxID=41117 RepID=UPI001884FBAD|nr:uncharacterized protein LOC119109783 [Pollicipes pollicipes]
MTPLLPPLLLLLLAHRAAGQVFFKGQCPDPPTVVDFKTWLFEGTWYETQRWYSIKEKGHCMRHTFTDLGYGKMDVLTELTRKKSYEYRRGLAHLEAAKTTGYGEHKHSYGQTKYTIAYNDEKSDKGDDETFFVLDTDYWTYAIIWSCSDKKFFNMQYLRILTRSPYPHSHTLVRVYRELEYLGLDQEHLVLVDDKRECEYRIAQTHHKKGHYGHKGKGGGYGRRPERLPYPISYTSLLTEVKPGGSYSGGLEQAAGGYDLSGTEHSDDGYLTVGGGGGGYDVGSDIGLGGFGASGGSAGFAGSGGSAGSGGYGGGEFSSGSSVAGGYGQSYLSGDTLSLGGSGYSSGGGGYSAPSSGHSGSQGSSDVHGGGFGGGSGSSYTSYSSSGSGGKY